MLSMQQINQSLKDNFQRQLQDIKELPEDLARGYKSWVRGLIKQAAQQLSEASAPAQQAATTEE